jgi:caa(3)-type oxidase subunit IV
MNEQRERHREYAVVPPRRVDPLRTGWVVFLILAVLTAVEWFVAVLITANLPILIVIALAKAGLIVHYFMHIVRLWQGGEEEA